jgi:hypothetical protein
VTRPQKLFNDPTPVVRAYIDGFVVASDRWRLRPGAELKLYPGLPAQAFAYSRA